MNLFSQVKKWIYEKRAIKPFSFGGRWYGQMRRTYSSDNSPTKLLQPQMPLEVSATAPDGDGRHQETLFGIRIDGLLHWRGKRTEQVFTRCVDGLFAQERRGRRAKKRNVLLALTPDSKDRIFKPRCGMGSHRPSSRRYGIPGFGHVCLGGYVAPFHQSSG